MRRSAALAIAALLIVMVAAAPLSEADAGSSTETLYDGTEYGYTTYGSDYSTYRSTIDSVSSDAEGVWISTTLEGYNVTIIGEGAADMPNAAWVVVPERVLTIESGAFSACGSLTDVYFLGDMPEIADGAFPDGASFHVVSGTSGWDSYEGAVDCIEEATQEASDGSSVRYLIIEGEAAAFEAEPSEDGSVTVESEASGYPVTSVAAYCMAGGDNEDGTNVEPRTDVVSVAIGDGVELIRERAFYYSTGLESVDIPDSVAAIMDEAFRAAGSLVSADIPGSVEYLGFECFRHCTSLPSISVPDSVTFMGEGAFKVCSSAESLVVGSGLEEISAWAFCYCYDLTSVEFRGSPTVLGAEAFYNCTSLPSVELPDSVVSIGASSFYYCLSLESVGLGSSLESVGASAFQECSSLSSVTFPETLDSIGRKAFAYCTSLTEAVFLGPMPDMDSTAFLSTGVTIHVAAAYADSWASYDGEFVVDGEEDGGDWLLAAVAALVVAVAALAVCAAVVRRRSHRGRCTGLVRVPVNPVFMFRGWNSARCSIGGSSSRVFSEKVVKNLRFQSIL